MKLHSPFSTAKAAIALCFAPAGFFCLISGCKKEAPPAKPEPRPYAQASYALPEATPDQPSIRFADATRDAGLDFTHQTGAFGKKWMPETMGSGGGFLDFDNDGHADIFLVNGSFWPGHESTGPPPTMKLFRNKGGATFEDVTERLGLSLSVYGMGCTFGDYDGDGDADIYVTAVGDNLLLRNDGTRFTNVARELGVLGHDPDSGAAPSWSTGATWLDFDLDGWLDLFVANYVQWTPETDLYTTLDGKNKSYATPQQYKGQSCRLYRNLGGKGFADVTQAAGIHNPEGKSLGVVTADFDGDGRQDIFVSNDTQPNFLYYNNGDGTFSESAAQAGCGYDDTGRARAGMGVDVAELNNDSVPSIVIGNFTGEPVSLYSRIGPRLFQDAAGNTRLARPTLSCLTFGTLFGDFDLDGRQDLVIANGHIEPEINTVLKDVTFAQKPQLFWNNGEGGFVELTDAAGDAFTQPVVGRGLSAADYDNDGDLDLLLTVNGGPAKLLRNETVTPERQWIKVKLSGQLPNGQAMGAVITAQSGELTQRRTIRAASSYLSQSDSVVHLGLGSHTQLDRLTVRWPDGIESSHGPLSAKTLHVVKHPKVP